MDLRIRAGEDGSEMKYNSIKDLVFDFIHRSQGKIDCETITEQVLKAFPDSKWKATHWSWYKHQIKNGRFKDDFSAEEKKNLKLNRASPNLKTPEVEQKEEDAVKRVGDSILNHVRMMIREVTKDDDDYQFRLNRWIYARLMGDERRKKSPIKQQLWSMGITSCQDCNQEFTSLKGVEIHRKDSSRAYSLQNCELLCRGCHMKK